ncbi:MAG: hypothetical protein L6408_04165 [Nanoarchaeota archaeon]|nr:hypothetical protein [Nanoarchaeota archaeon]
MLILGLYLRFDDYAAEGYCSDDMNTIPAAVFAYYPHDYFPGLVSTEPPLGNYIIGLGCMASGEDFSGVSNVKPLFFPDRSAYIGKAMKNAENYCWAPVYIFGILFILGIIIFAFSFFPDIYSATYFITFFIFFTAIIQASRTLKVDIILFTFVIFSLIFLWKGYKTNKGLFKEKIYFLIAFAFLGLSSATKFPMGALIVFSFLLILEKYYRELLYFLQKGFEKIDIHIFKNKFDKSTINPQSLLINMVIAISSSSFFLMLFFNFSLKNLFDTYHYMTSLNWAGVQALGFSLPNFFQWLGEFLAQLNIFDIFIFIFSIFIFIKIIFKKPKTKQEKFALYLIFLCILLVTIFKSGIMVHLVHTIPFMFGFFILMSLTFSDKKYSIFNTFKIKKKYFLVFIMVYSLVSFLTLYFAPFHHAERNPLVCSLTNIDSCKITFQGNLDKPTSAYFESILNEDETFLPTGISNFYIRHNDDILWWMFYSSFQKQTGKEPRLQDYLKYYEPEGRRVRYIYADTLLETNPDSLTGIHADLYILKKNYKPNHVIKIYNRDAAYIYDLENLIKK